MGLAFFLAPIELLVLDLVFPADLLIQGAPKPRPTTHSNACFCPAPLTSLSQLARYFTHSSPSGFAISMASLLSSVPAKTILSPRNASEWASLHRALPQSPQKKSFSSMPTS